MELYIPISHLNDFIFCPLSIYYHWLYGGISTRLYQELPQVEGKQAHEAIEEKRYSTRKNILQGVEVYSTVYNLCGKIDTFDVDEGLLTERKKHIEKIYDGYVFQLYGQYYGLCEMGYRVNSLRFYSMDDNKIYPVKLPDEDTDMRESFKNTIMNIMSLDLENYLQTNKAKCGRCIYEPLCDRSNV